MEVRARRSPAPDPATSLHLAWHTTTGLLDDEHQVVTFWRDFAGGPQPIALPVCQHEGADECVDAAAMLRVASAGPPPPEAAPGEDCRTVQDMGPGGWASGDLAGAADDIASACTVGGVGDRVLHFRVPGGPGELALVRIVLDRSDPDVRFELRGVACDNPPNTARRCLQGEFRERIPAGDYWIVAERATQQAMRYQVGVAIRDAQGRCLSALPDLPCADHANGDPADDPAPDPAGGDPPADDGRGEDCGTPFDLGEGGTWSGDLAGAGRHEAAACANFDGPERILQFLVPGRPDAGLDVLILTDGSHPELDFVLKASSCRVGNTVACFGVFGPQAYWLASGAYFLHIRRPSHLQGPVPFRVTVATRNPDGSCRRPDQDRDGATICDRDCDDRNPSVGPGRLETCDGRDQDCNGKIDDVAGACQTGLPGLCDAGRAVCRPGGGQGCEQLRVPVREVCADGEDNDCDGAMDEDPAADRCDVRPEGDTCELAFDASDGGIWRGNMQDLRNDLPDGCGGGPAGNDVVFRIDVPGRPGVPGPVATREVHIRTHGSSPGVRWSLRRGDCAGSDTRSCLWADATDLQLLEPGTWWIVGKWADRWQSPNYALAVAVRSPEDGRCRPDDQDGDGVTMCDGGCDDSLGGVAPGAEERCNGVDDDCDGRVDDIEGVCATGGVGRCGVGKPYCEAGMALCSPLFERQEEVCRDLRDNNCDGRIDEGQCRADPPAETCAGALRLAPFQFLEGDLAQARFDEIPGSCVEGGKPDHVYRLDVPRDPQDLNRPRDVRIDVMALQGEVGVVVLRDSCAGREAACYLSPGGFLGRLDPGTWYVVISDQRWAGESARYEVFAEIR